MKIGSTEGIRTHTIWFLRPAPPSVGLQCHLKWASQIDVVVLHLTTQPKGNHKNLRFNPFGYT